MGLYTSDRVLSDTDSTLLGATNELPLNTVNERLRVADEQGKQFINRSLHCNADVRIGFVRAYIVYPSVIYGVLDGPLVKAGVAHAYSVTMVVSVKLSILRGQGAMVGKGLNKCPAAHIKDSTCL